jgi:hypothetical protein
MAKRMALVPADMMGHIKEAPMLTQITALDREMGSILNNKGLSTDMKFRQYQDALQRYQMLLHERDKPAVPPPPIDNQKLPKELLLRDVPNQKKKKAKLLFDFIENIPELSVTRRNEIQINGETIENSNIVDIFADLTLDRQRVAPLRGFREFVTLLQRHNVPLEAIGNRRRREALLTPAPPSAASTPASRQRGTPGSTPASTPGSRGSAGRRRQRQASIGSDDGSPRPRHSRRISRQVGPRQNYARINRGAPIPYWDNL